ncbi:hypothetical protein [Paenibacillus radicis (ex Gao et al. 2016)]|uniref:Uncharacterized protein n=1 Tax=Paenibacillus radicis (ex Gao et al. 2016) TaxID=1737354 RepID=A0A917H9U5_9BACL|nr:hypothetical protein [Paenibacillus radicis (ex Gao et al. 2016)]GGG72321.1 hypothetical protein GCM10010918_30120 [Paenibacillus radicis (ex Gao et al. 2016)]
MLRSSGTHRPKEIASRGNEAKEAQRPAAQPNSSLTIMQLQSAVGNRAALQMLQSAPKPVGEVIQRQIHQVKKGKKPSNSSWTLTKSDDQYDYYDDGEDELETKLQPTRDILDDLGLDDLSSAEESDTELDAQTQSTPIKVYRVNNIRDTMKVKKHVLKKDPNGKFGIKVNGTVFRMTGSGSQFKLQTTSQKALLQSDNTQKEGYMQDRVKGDRSARGKQGSYLHVVSELEGHSAKDVATDIYQKFHKGIDYPDGKYTDRVQGKMNELFAVLTVTEGYRTDYALSLYTAAIEAMKNGNSFERVLYKGKGQLEALHPGASSHTDSKVSGQLMEQNIGMGSNNPHPTQSSMNISHENYVDGLSRTVELFDEAIRPGRGKKRGYSEMLKDDLVEPFQSFKRRKLAPKAVTIQPADVSSTRTPNPSWNVDVSLKLNAGVQVKRNQKVKYNGKDYIVKNITPTGWVQLLSDT